MHRHELYSDYKAQRPPMPDAMKLAIPKIQILLEVWAADQLISHSMLVNIHCTLSFVTTVFGWQCSMAIVK